MHKNSNKKNVTGY